MLRFLNHELKKLCKFIRHTVIEKFELNKNIQIALPYLNFPLHPVGTSPFACSIRSTVACNNIDKTVVVHKSIVQKTVQPLFGFQSSDHPENFDQLDCPEFY